MSKKSPAMEGDGASAVIQIQIPGKPSPAPKKRKRIPDEAHGIQVNACANPNCANFAVPAETARIKPGVPKGFRFRRAFPTRDAAACRKVGCQNHTRTIATAPGEYVSSGENKYGDPRWRCRRCGARLTTANPAAPAAPAAPAQPTRKDRYGTSRDQLKCHNCGQMTTIKSNVAIAQETARITRYLKKRPGASCANRQCSSHGRSVEENPDLYQSFGTTRRGVKRFRCKACKRTLSIGSSITRQRRSDVNIWLFKLLHSRVSLSKIASLLEISPPTVYDKINFLDEQCAHFQGYRERELCSQRFDELHLATDRQAYLCNWNAANDARNLQIMSIGTADIASGYVVGMNVAYDPEPDALDVEADAIATGDYEKDPPQRRYARRWLEGDYSESAKRAEDVRKRRRTAKNSKTAIAADATLEEQAQDADATDDEQLSGDEVVFSSRRKLPDNGMLVHADYTMIAHLRLVRQLLRNAERISLYAEKEPGIRTAIMSTFADEICSAKLEAFHVLVDKEFTVRQKRQLVARANAEFRSWLKTRREEGKLTFEDWREARLIRLMEAIAEPKAFYDGRTKKPEYWIMHPFPNLAEPSKRVLHITGRPTRLKKGMELRPRPPVDARRLAELVDGASLHAVDRYFMQIRRELAGLERGIHVASNQHRIWYGYSPYDAAMIPKLINIHRAYYNWIQVGGDRETRAERFGLARGKIRHQDIIYY